MNDKNDPRYSETSLDFRGGTPGGVVRKTAVDVEAEKLDVAKKTLEEMRDIKEVAIKIEGKLDKDKDV